MRDRVFSGRYDRQLDDKGRLALPARLRASLGEQVYLARGRDRCVNVVPADVFVAEAMRMRERVDRGELDENVLRAVVSSSALVTLDRQGRVGIEEHLRTYAGIALGSTVKVTGAVDRLEIWDAARYERIDDLHARKHGGDDE
ncbi:MAG: division/cell wall cluster transcriptional repressor MraZ [Ilumatobacteraceae bacterium]